MKIGLVLQHKIKVLFTFLYIYIDSYISTQSYFIHGKHWVNWYRTGLYYFRGQDQHIILKFKRNALNKFSFKWLTLSNGKSFQPLEHYELEVVPLQKRVQLNLSE